MSNKTIFISLWYTSIFFLALTLVFFAIFLLRYWNTVFIVPIVVCFSLFLVCHIVSKKNLRCEDGYTVIDAITFYFECEKAGYSKTNKSNESVILTEVAKNENLFNENTDIKILIKCYKNGKSAVKEINNPLILLLWKLQKKPIK